MVKFLALEGAGEGARTERAEYVTRAEYGARMAGFEARIAGREGGARLE